jgi:hypothetical protein
LRGDAKLGGRGAPLRGRGRRHTGIGRSPPWRAHTEHDYARMLHARNDTRRWATNEAQTSPRQAREDRLRAVTSEASVLPSRSRLPPQAGTSATSQSLLPWTTSRRAGRDCCSATNRAVCSDPADSRRAIELDDEEQPARHGSVLAAARRRAWSSLANVALLRLPPRSSAGRGRATLAALLEVAHSSTRDRPAEPCSQASRDALNDGRVQHPGAESLEATAIVGRWDRGANPLRRGKPEAAGLWSVISRDPRDFGRPNRGLGRSHRRLRP